MHHRTTAAGSFLNDDTSGPNSTGSGIVPSWDIRGMIDSGRLQYERLTGALDKIHGVDIGSNHANQSLTLAKQFRPDG